MLSEQNKTDSLFKHQDKTHKELPSTPAIQLWLLSVCFFLTLMGFRGLDVTV